MKKHSLYAVIVLVIAAYYMVAHAFHTTCLFRLVTGVPCPTCGMTRSLWALAHFRLRQSLYYHPMTLPFCLALLLGLFRNKMPLKARHIDSFIIFVAIATLAVYFIRLSAGMIP